VLDLSGAARGIVVDKHSTGGVGDKTTLVAAPLAAACGLAVGKMSGRGLGFSGGTIDKLEAIPGYRTNLTTAEFLQQLRTLGIVLTGQSADLAPADGKLYALRDVTGTVQSIPLIASSIMSKKIAAGAQAILLDVKLGQGAFMETIEDARKLAELMVSIARLSGRKALALLSDMNQPLGEAVGNALELKEAIATLHGGGPADYREHCLVITAHMLVLGQVRPDLEAARRLAEQRLEGGQAWEKLTALVRAQGGDVSFVEQPDRLSKAPLCGVVSATQSGFVRAVNARTAGETVVMLGGGRQKKGDPIDYGVGLVVHVKVGDPVEAGQPLCSVYANDQAGLEEAQRVMQAAFALSPAPVERLPLFYGVIE
jgi:pyrimidine-nucleoside phosphorylase